MYCDVVNIQPRFNFSDDIIILNSTRLCALNLLHQLEARSRSDSFLSAVVSLLLKICACLVVSD